MRGPVFFDTNVLVYTYHQKDPAKHQIAIDLVFNNVSKKETVISSQVINEFCNVVLTKSKPVMSTGDLLLVNQEVLYPMLAHIPTLEFYQRAVELHKSTSISFYDALIVQAALDLNCRTLYSEDLQDGQKYGTLTVVNPFKDC